MQTHATILCCVQLRTHAAYVLAFHGWECSAAMRTMHTVTSLHTRKVGSERRHAPLCLCRASCNRQAWLLYAVKAAHIMPLRVLEAGYHLCALHTALNAQVFTSNDRSPRPDPKLKKKRKLETKSMHCPRPHKENRHCLRQILLT